MGRPPPARPPRLVGLPDAGSRSPFTDRNGHNLERRRAPRHAATGAGGVRPRPDLALTQLWYDQNYFDGALDWKVGRLTVGEDFASFDCDFMNLTFCGSQPGNIVGDYWYNWPVSQWATRLKVNLPAATYAQVGVYQQNNGFLESSTTPTSRTTPRAPRGRSSRWNSAGDPS